MIPVLVTVGWVLLSTAFAFLLSAGFVGWVVTSSEPPRRSGAMSTDVVCDCCDGRGFHGLFSAHERPLLLGARFAAAFGVTGQPALSAGGLSVR